MHRIIFFAAGFFVSFRRARSTAFHIRTDWWTTYCLLSSDFASEARSWRAIARDAMFFRACLRKTFASGDLAEFCELQIKESFASADIRFTERIFVISHSSEIFTCSDRRRPAATRIALFNATWRLRWWFSIGSLSESRTEPYIAMPYSTFDATMAAAICGRWTIGTHCEIRRRDPVLPFMDGMSPLTWSFHESVLFICIPSTLWQSLKRQAVVFLWILTIRQSNSSFFRISSLIIVKN